MDRNQNNDNDLHKVEDLKRKIFSKSYNTKIEQRHPFLTQFNADKIKDSFTEEAKNNEALNLKNKSFFKNFLIFSIIVFLGAVGFLLFNLFFENNNISNENIEISVIGNTFVDGGEKLPLIVEIVNNNPIQLEFADLVVEYAKGSTLTQSGEIQRLRQSIGYINANTVINEKIEVLLFGEQGSIHQIKISLEYRTPDSNSIFIKDKLYEVTINSTPIDLAIDAPIEITPNQDFTLKVKADLNNFENENNLNMILKLDYPFGFEFVDSNPKPVLGNNVWDLNELKSQNKSEVVITGKMIDVFDGDQKVFNVFAGPEKSDNKSEIDVVFNSLAHNVVIKKPFIGTFLSVNSKYSREYAVSANELILGGVNWVNNLSTSIDDLEIRAKLSGNAFDEKNITLNGKGFYDSVNDTVVWDKNTEELFDEVRPFANGLVTFSLKPASIFDAKGELLIDPVINVELSITGKQSVIGNVLDKLDAVEKKVIKIASELSLIQKTNHATNPIKNTGPFPPKAEQETTYTITLSVANTLNNISRAQVITTLAPRVSYKEVFVPKGSNVSFNSNTRELTWNIGNIKRGEGIKTPLKELSFEVSYTPSLSEVGKNLVLVNNSVLTGFDDFANVDLRASKGALQVNGKITE